MAGAPRSCISATAATIGIDCPGDITRGKPTISATSWSPCELVAMTARWSLPVFSLGGNVLLKYLGENGVATPLDGAVGICVPLDLHDSADALSIGFSNIYQYHLVNKMKNAIRRKFDEYTAAFDWYRTMAAKTFAEFDDAVTAPLHGFSGKDEYYDKCSSIGYLSDIRIPTLIINALDDPFMTPAGLPSPNQLSDSVTLELSSAGGHIGFIDGGYPWKPSYYLPDRIIGHLEQAIAASGSGGRSLPGL